MAEIIRVQKGTKDILPAEIDLWHFMEEKALEVFSNAGYKEIRTPIFEATELFARFVEALFIDTNAVTQIAPYTYLVFCKELTNNKYLELADFINKFF